MTHDVLTQSNPLLKIVHGEAADPVELDGPPPVLIDARRETRWTRMLQSVTEEVSERDFVCDIQDQNADGSF